MHAFVAAPLSLYSALGSCNIVTSDSCARHPRPIAEWTIVISSGFCIYDLAVCVFCLHYSLQNSFESQYIFHHVISLAGAALSLSLGGHNVSLAAACLVTEFSDLFMNARWFMLKHGNTATKAYKVVNLLFAGTFFVTRVLFLAAILWRQLTLGDLNQEPERMNTLLLGSLWCLQVLWFGQVTKAVS